MENSDFGPLGQEEPTSRAGSDANGADPSDAPTFHLQASDNYVTSTFEVTFFPDQYATEKFQFTCTLAELAENIQKDTLPDKASLSWLKLATFGDVRTDKNCLRHGANMLAITGVEGDYDGGEVGFDEAVARIRAAKLQAVLYTTPSHTEAKPHWRVVTPFSAPLEPARRDELMDRLNGAIGGGLARESWTLAQAYYFGNIEGRPPVQVEIVDGDYIDQRPDIVSIPKPGATGPGGAEGGSCIQDGNIYTRGETSYTTNGNHVAVTTPARCWSYELDTPDKIAAFDRYLDDHAPMTPEDDGDDYVGMALARDWGLSQAMSVERAAQHGGDEKHAAQCAANVWLYGQNPPGEKTDEANFAGMEKRMKAAGAGQEEDVTRRSDGRIEIQMAGGTLVPDLNLIEEALSMPQSRVYRCNGTIVQIIDTKVTVRDGDTVEDKGIAELKGRGLIEPIMRTACPVKWNAKQKKLVPINCPLDVADSYLARGSWPKLPPLTGITNAPTLRHGGSLLDRPGYDRATGLLFLPQAGVNFPAIPSAPTHKDARVALVVLDELIGKFPFVSDVDRSVAVAALLTGVVRRMLPTAPAFGFSAPTPGTGKGLLVNTVAMVAMGRKPAQVTLSNETEDEKQLGALLIRGDQVISIDNCARDQAVGGKKLNSVLTEEIAGLRVLGHSQIVDCMTNALFLINGNNLSIAADMNRRVLMCHLDAGVDDPERRQFDYDPVDRVRRDRGRYVAACLTILRAYLAAGSPIKSQPLGSYEQWNALAGGAVQWLDLADPTESIRDNKAEDPEAEMIGGVLRGWQQIIGVEEWITAKEVYARAQTAGANGKPEFAEAIRAALSYATGRYTPGSEVKALGQWLKQYKNRPVGGLRVVPSNKTDGDGIRLWSLEQTGQVLQFVFEAA